MVRVGHKQGEWGKTGLCNSFLTTLDALVAGRRWYIVFLIFEKIHYMGDMPNMLDDWANPSFHPNTYVRRRI